MLHCGSGTAGHTGCVDLLKSYLHRFPVIVNCSSVLFTAFRVCAEVCKTKPKREAKQKQPKQLLHQMQPMLKRQTPWNPERMFFPQCRITLAACSRDWDHSCALQPLEVLYQPAQAPCDCKPTECHTGGIAALWVLPACFTRCTPCNVSGVYKEYGHAAWAVDTECKDWMILFVCMIKRPEVPL